MPSEHSDKLSLGPSFLFWRPKVEKDKTVKFTSTFQGSSPPNPLLKDVAWPTSGMFLPTTDEIDVKPLYSEEEQSIDLVPMPVDVFYSGAQGYEISTGLPYNRMREHLSFGLLPGKSNGVNGSSGGKIYPDMGDLILMITNVYNSDKRYHHLVRIFLFYNMRVKPGGFTLKNGHFITKTAFKTVAPVDSDGFYYAAGGQAHNDWVISIYNPSVILGSNGGTIDTTPDVPTPLVDSVLLNL